MRGDPEGGELDPAVDVRRRCKKNFSSVLFRIGNRTKEGCDRGSEVGTYHGGRYKDTKKRFTVHYVIIYR